MSDEIVETKNLPAITAAAEDIWLRDHSSTTMTTDEFALWLNQNLASSDVQNALKQAAFMLCCDVIAQDISKSTLRLRERLDNGTSRVVAPTKHALAAMLALEPNRRHTWNEFNEMLVYWDCLVSNAYAGVFRNIFGEPVELIPFQSGRVREYVEGRDVFYEVIAGTMQEQALLGSPSRRFVESDMIHVRSRMLDGMDGYATLTAGADVLSTGDAIDDYRESLFQDEGQMRGVFRKKDTNPLDETAFQRLRQQLKELMRRYKAGTAPIVLEGDMEFQQISANPMQMEIVKQFQEHVTQICRLLRVPPHKVFLMDGTKYENLETMEKAYVGDTLIPRAERFEHRFSKILLSRAERLRYYFEFDREEMTLRDSQRETERIKMLLERGAILVDEARAAFGYTELPNGQGKQRTIPANMNVVDESGKVVIAAQNKPEPGSTGDAPAKPAAKPAKDAEPQLKLISGDKK